jgi:hypothetical protein
MSLHRAFVRKISKFKRENSLGREPNIEDLGAASIGATGIRRSQSLCNFSAFAQLRSTAKPCIAGKMASPTSTSCTPMLTTNRLN